MTSKYVEFDVSDVPNLLHYDPETGVFTRKRYAGGQHPGAVAGTIGPKGYRVISVKNRLCRASRLAWALTHDGVWPVQEIDHINGLKDDNRIANLRLATRQENCFNVDSKGNKSGLKGVKHKRGSLRWEASISIGGKKYFLGYFGSPEEAHEAYKDAAREFHGEFYREPTARASMLTLEDFVGSPDPEGRLRDEMLEAVGERPPVNPADITPVELRALLDELGISAAELGRRLGHAVRSDAARRWVNTGPIPKPVRAVVAAWVELHRNDLHLPGAPIE